MVESTVATHPEPAELAADEEFSLEESVKAISPHTNPMVNIILDHAILILKTPLKFKSAAEVLILNIGKVRSYWDAEKKPKPEDAFRRLHKIMIIRDLVK